MRFLGFLMGISFILWLFILWYMRSVLPIFPNYCLILYISSQLSLPACVSSKFVINFLYWQRFISMFIDFHSVLSYPADRRQTLSDRHTDWQTDSIALSRSLSEITIIAYILANCRRWSRRRPFGARTIYNRLNVGVNTAWIQACKHERRRRKAEMALFPHGECRRRRRCPRRRRDVRE